MGACGSTLTPEQKAAIFNSKRIEEAAAKDFHRGQEKVRLLLLGAGESGKSTVFKQMKILYGKGFAGADLERWRAAVFQNTISSMKAVCQACEDLGLFEEVQAKPEFETMLDIPNSAEVDEEVARVVKTLWNDPGIQKTWERRSEFQVYDSNRHFFEKVEEISAASYVPNNDDILHSRIRTSGIVEEAYVINGVNFVIIDVGGQRNERKKWIHCFDSVNAVIFVAALSEYDQVLFEDNTQNRMVEALTLFDEMCNSRWFREIDMILFLNKRDLFEDKIKRKSIKDVEEFADYDGSPHSYDDGVQYFLNKFVSLNRCPKDIYHHVTCATDSNNVRVVFEACRQIILKKNLADSGIMM